MKSRRTHLAWIVSLVVHACLAVVVGYFAISLNQQKIQDAIDVSFFIVSPPEVAEREPVSKPVVVATPAPNLQVVPQTETTPRRTTLTRQAKASMTAAPTAPLTAGSPAALKTQHVNVSNSPSVLQHTTEALSTAAVLPTTSDALPTAGLRSGGVTTGSVGAGIGDNVGAGRGAFGSGTGVVQGRGQNHAGLDSLVAGAGVANINASLSDVTENMVLGNGVPQLPKGSPGAIIQGRGKEIIGRLNLVRLDDPLHPNLDF